MKTTLIIARHGNTFGPDDVVTRVGLTDLPLVESGLEQGRKLGRFLKENNLIPDAVFTSHLQRTQQTAEQAQAEMGTWHAPQALSLFNEIDYGPDENKPEADVIARVGRDAITAWEETATPPPGWNINPARLMEDWQRFADDIRHHYAGKKILVVTSNGIARFAPCLTGDFVGFRQKHALKIATGALCLFENTGTPAWICTGWNIRPE